ncbi:MAG: hypothetical protein U9N86_11985 [Bacteroidota bacterium]|nr:hypothetical protein [Bacteroidota bacterium]
MEDINPQPEQDLKNTVKEKWSQPHVYDLSFETTHGKTYYAPNELAMNEDPKTIGPS